jgi:hypothetical protein
MKLFKEYTESLMLPQQILEEILDQKTFDSHYLYLSLIPFISPVYPTVSEEQREQLNFGSYLYFRFLLLFDNAMDSVSEEQSKLTIFQKLNTGFVFFEKSVRTLTQLYSDNEVFWEAFAKMKKQYFETVVLEKKISAKKQAFDKDLFEKIAVGKSAICLTTVYAMGVLNGSDKNQEALLDCLKELHIALQYLDDIDDFKQDIQEGQWTYPQYLVEQYLIQQQIVVTDTKILHKYLYLSGIAQELVRRAESHIAKSVEFANECGLDDFAHYLEKRRESCDFHWNEIENLLNKTKIKSLQSTDIQAANSIKESMQNGLGYIRKHLNEKTQWSDFLTSAGQATTWTSAYVGLNLAEIDIDLAELGVVYEQLISEDSLSFNKSIIQDGDSTNFVIGFGQVLKGKTPIKYQEKWLKFMNKDGSWCTYIDEDSLRERLELGNDISVKGWLLPHTCVTAAAAYMLASIPELRTEYNTTCKYLLRQLDSKNFLESYWWTSNVYATAWGMMALSKHSQYAYQSLYLGKWIIKQQNLEGAWLNSYTDEFSPLYTALATKALILCNNPDFDSAIEKGIDWLLKNQTSDGSWQTNRILRIPATDVQNPLEVRYWRNSSFGVNCLVDDHNRLFTTSTVLNVLNLKNNYNNVSNRRNKTHTV